jgi:hypothetical protein
LKNLEGLHFIEVAFPPGALRALASLGTLKTVAIERTWLVHADLVDLAEIHGLKHLSLLNMGIGDRSVETLGRMTSLTSLEVWDKKITRDGRERLKSLLPDCLLCVNGHFLHGPAEDEFDDGSELDCEEAAPAAPPAKK